MGELTDKQKLHVQSIAMYRLLDFLSENKTAARWAREDSETLGKLFLEGCQAGCAAAIAVAEDIL